jgi:hypothetical protein
VGQLASSGPGTNTLLARRQPSTLDDAALEEFVRLFGADRHAQGAEARPLRHAFGAFGAVLRELVWKMPIFSWKVVPKNPNASYL